MNPHLVGLTEFHRRQRDRIERRFATAKRRKERQRMDMDTTEEQPLSVLSDSLDAYSLEIKS